MKTRSCIALTGAAFAFAFGSAGAQAAPPSSMQDAVYVAHLQPINSKLTGLETTGEARFTVSGDKLEIKISVKGAPPGVTHWQHFHGFKDDKAAACATQAADANHDGIIDLIETEPASGTTMVPFDENPVAMDVAHGAYPKASADGTYEYHETVSLKALSAAFGKAFGHPDLDLDRRVVIVHGVPAATRLPSSVASLGPIPAHVTLPIACGKIERLKK